VARGPEVDAEVPAIGKQLSWLVPYVALRLSGALYLSYGNGLYCIEPGPKVGSPVVAWFWLSTGAYQRLDIWLCTRFVPAPAGG
jgi:hypothetical protein